MQKNLLQQQDRDLVPSYKEGDRNALREIAEEYLPLLKLKVQAVHEAHKKMWFASNKVIGWSNLDIRYGGIASRCDTAIELIGSYLDGRLDTLEELEQTRLHKNLSGFARYATMASPIYNI